MNASFYVKALVFFFIRVVSYFIAYIVKKHLFQDLALTHKPKSVCAPELVLLIFKFHTLGLILESAHLLTLLPLFLIALTLILSK